MNFFWLLLPLAYWKASTIVPATSSVSHQNEVPDMNTYWKISVCHRIECIPIPENSSTTNLLQDALPLELWKTINGIIALNSKNDITTTPKRLIYCDGSTSSNDWRLQNYREKAFRLPIFVAAPTASAPRGQGHNFSTEQSCRVQLDASYINTNMNWLPSTQYSQTHIYNINTKDVTLIPYIDRYMHIHKYTSTPLK